MNCHHGYKNCMVCWQAAFDFLVEEQGIRDRIMFQSRKTKTCTPVMEKNYEMFSHRNATLHRGLEKIKVMTGSVKS